MPIRAVFFDLDDTLLPTTSSRRERATRAFERLKADHPDHKGLRFDSFFHNITAYDHSTGFSRGMQPVLEDLGLWETPAGKAAHGLWFFDGALDLIEPYPLACETIEALRSEYRLGLITNGEGIHQRRKFEALGIAQHFDFVLVSGEFGHLKPNRAIFREALARAGVEPHEAVHVGDHIEADVWGAQSVGMRAIWFNAERRRSHYDDATPDATVTSYLELRRVLEKWSRST